ncbi:MAG TPA: type II toxin-antitoxin system RelE/ParE family toxin [Hyphomicrobiales bacterium]|nr:type II toxin-antitoxin system RelE/ParE family toxin [Hyphomicrobiales bacterium]
MRIRYTPSSLAELDDILDYIAERSPQGARKVQARIKQIINLIALHPLIGRITDDAEVRRITTSPYPYLIFYEVTDTEIIIRRIRHAARKPD